MNGVGLHLLRSKMKVLDKTLKAKRVEMQSIPS